jgi:hypothetical protein
MLILKGKSPENFSGGFTNYRDRLAQNRASNGPMPGATRCEKVPSPALSHRPMQIYQAGGLARISNLVAGPSRT